MRPVDEQDEEVVASGSSVRVAELRRVALALLLLAQMLDRSLQLAFRDDPVRDVGDRFVIVTACAASRRERAQKHG